MASEDISLNNYYSLMELIEKLGKEGLAELVAKGKPQRITKGDMIFFLKSDVDRIMGMELLDDQSVSLIVENVEEDFVSKLVFKETLIKRHQLGSEEEIYRDKILDLSKEILYGRSCGDEQLKKAFQGSGIISSLHAKLYLDDEKNLLYENLGANKSKVRGCKDKEYIILEAKEIAVLIPKEVFEDILLHPQIVSVSIKLGYQLKPHFIIRINVSKA